MPFQVKMLKDCRFNKRLPQFGKDFSIVCVKIIHSFIQIYNDVICDQGQMMQYIDFTAYLKVLQLLMNWPYRSNTTTLTKTLNITLLFKISTRFLYDYLSIEIAVVGWL